MLIEIRNASSLAPCQSHLDAAADFVSYIAESLHLHQDLDLFVGDMVDDGSVA